MQHETHDTALAQLADIHLPQPVGFWPPAPGWWLAALLLLAGLWFGGRWTLAFRRRRRNCRQALRELERVFDDFAAADADADADADQSSMANPRCVNAVNSVLRRVALTHFPDTSVAGLGGEDWVRFLRANGNSMRLDRELAQALSKGRFQPSLTVDMDRLEAFGRQWIRSIYLRRRGNRRPPSENQAQGGLEVARGDA